MLSIDYTCIDSLIQPVLLEAGPTELTFSSCLRTRLKAS